MDLSHSPWCMAWGLCPGVRCTLLLVGDGLWSVLLLGVGLVTAFLLLGVGLVTAWWCVLLLGGG